MSTTTSWDNRHTLDTAAPAAQPPRFVATARDVVRSEWTKLRTVRSTFWSLAAAAAAIVGLGAATCAATVASAGDPGMGEMMGATDPTQVSLSGLSLAQLAIGVLGVLVIASEFGTGMIRSTFAAVPNRTLVLAAKAAVFTAVAFVVGVASSMAAFLLGQAVLRTGDGPTASLGDPGVARAVVGAGLYLAVLGLLAFGLGAVIRHTAGAVAALFGLVLVAPLVVNFLPQEWKEDVGKYLPSTAGNAITAVQQAPNTLAPWTGLGVFLLYALAAVAVAVVLVNRRDA